MSSVHCIVQLLTVIRVLVCTQNNAKQHQSSLVLAFLSGLLEANSPPLKSCKSVDQWFVYLSGTHALSYSGLRKLLLWVTSFSSEPRILATTLHCFSLWHLCILLASSSLWMAFSLHWAPKGCIFLRLSPEPAATPFLPEKLKRLHSLRPVWALHTNISPTPFLRPVVCFVC